MDSGRFQQAVALRLAGRYEESLREVEALTSIETDTYYKSSLLLGQATCLAWLGRLKEARQRWSESARLWSNQYTELVDAYLCAGEGKCEEATCKLIRFLKNHENDLREPGNEDTYSEASERLSYLLFEAKRYEASIHYLNDALIFPASDRRKRQLCFYLGMCHLETGDPEAAERKLIESLPANFEDPLWAQVQFQLGRVYFQQGCYAKAKQAFESCEFFSDEANTELKQGISTWLARIATYLPTKNSVRQGSN